MDLAVLVLQDTLDEALGREGIEDSSDVGGEIRPHGKTSAGRLFHAFGVGAGVGRGRTGQGCR